MDPEEYANFAQIYQQNMNNFVLQTGIALATAISSSSNIRRFGVHEINKKRHEKGIKFGLIN
jgi:hypothetical protein